MAERKVVTDNQLAALATDVEVATAVSDHSADTTSVHGIADTSALATDAEVAAGYQPLDSDLTAIAALTTTSFGRSLLEAANAGGAQTTLGVSTFIKTLLDDADAATARATLGLTQGYGSYPNTGRYYGTPGLVSNSSTSLNRMSVTPVVLLAACTANRIGFRLVTAGTAGAVVRLGIYADNNGLPGALILDAGTLPCDIASGNYELTISQALSAGQVWLADCPQVATSTRAGNLSHSHPQVAATTLAGALQFTSAAYYQDSVSGALPNPMVIADVTASAPRTVIRAA